MSTSACNNEQWAKRQLAVMPWGSSTCSKAAKYGPEEPNVIVRGKGCRVWDADGREFIDFRNGLGPVTLGYAFPEVNKAMMEQMEHGSLYGHPHTLECEVAEMLAEVIPCAQKVRFLKTGGEAVAACIRLARAYTNRDRIIQVGYNGWLNSLAVGGLSLPGVASSAGPRGVPEALSRLHHGAVWGKLEQVERYFEEYPQQIAAVVISAGYPDMELGKTYLPALQELVHRNGALLVFDEIVTGFRITIGGVQEHFKVTPDLAVFAKGIANGMPLSTYCGRAEVMDLLQEVIVSSTYGGEAVTLAAARACIEFYKNHGVIEHLWRVGEMMWSGANKLFEKHKLPLRMKGFWPCATITAQPEAPRELMPKFFRAAYTNRVSLYGTNYVNFSHKPADVQEALERLNRACEQVAKQG